MITNGKGQDLTSYKFLEYNHDADELGFRATVCSGEHETESRRPEKEDCGALAQYIPSKESVPVITAKISSEKDSVITTKIKMAREVQQIRINEIWSKMH